MAKASKKIDKNPKELRNLTGRQIITSEIIDQLESFFKFSQPSEFRENLIEIYHSYILHQHHSLPYNFKELTEGILIFLDFLKFADEEFREQAQSKYLKKELPKKAALKQKPQPTRTGRKTPAGLNDTHAQQTEKQNESL
jgi:hypothetical protein